MHQIGGHAEALEIAFDIVKEQRRPLPLDHQLIDRSDFKIPIGVIDHPKFSSFFRAFEKPLRSSIMKNPPLLSFM